MGACCSKQGAEAAYKLDSPQESSVPPLSPRADQELLQCQNRLFGFRSCPFTSRIRLAIQYKGVHFEPCWQTEADDCSNFDWLRGECPNVLALQHGEDFITGSSDEIIQYVDDTLKEPPLIPSGDIEQHVREWTSYVRDKFSPLVGQLLVDGSSSTKRELVPKLEAVFGRLDHAIWEYSNGGPYFFGSQFTMTDVYLMPFLNLVQLLTYFRGVEISSGHSRLLSYTKRLESCSIHVPVRLDMALLKYFIATKVFEGEPPPVVIITTLQHQSILSHLDRLVHLADELADCELSPEQKKVSVQMKVLSDAYGQLVEIMQEHAQMEEKVVFPALENANTGVTQIADDDHARDLPIMNGIREDIKSITALERSSPVRGEGLLALAIRFRTFQDYTRAHFQEEEKNLLPILEEAELGIKPQEIMVTRCFSVMESSHSHLLPYFLSGLRPDDIYRYMAVAQKSLGDSKPVLLRRMIQLLKAADDELLSVWKVIQERLPELATRWDTAAGS